MNKQELVAAVAEQTMMSKAKSEAAVNAALKAITSELAKGGAVSLIGFGRFEVRRREARSARNPQSGESMLVPARAVPAFKPGSQLKEAIN